MPKPGEKGYKYNSGDGSPKKVSRWKLGKPILNQYLDMIFPPRGSKNKPKSNKIGTIRRRKTPKRSFPIKFNSNVNNKKFKKTKKLNQ